MSESLRDRVARVMGEHETFGHVGFRDEQLTHRWHCPCGWSTEPVAFDGDTVDTSPACEHVADALIAAGLVTEPRGRVRASEVLDRMGDRVGPKDYPLANLIYDAASRMRRNENEQEDTS